MSVKHKMKSRLPLLLVFITGLLFVSLFYGKILIAPDDYIFSNNGDGIKNYFTYAYHVKHNTSFLNFEGMNYPYGEHFLYTDCHPILAICFKLLSKKWPFFENHSIGILNYLMISSIIITFLICYFLLNEFKFNKWLNVLFSITITLLAPQLFRLSGHLSMSYSIAIPLSWLIMLKFFKSEQKSLILLLFLNNLFWFFIHAYLGIIITSFLILLVLFKLLIDRKSITNMMSYMGLIVSVLAPVILFYAFILFTDTHIGRTTNPSGFFLYNAEFDDILLPSYKPFRPLLNKLAGNIIKLEWEARGYIGMVNSLFFIALIIILFISSFIKQTRILLNTFFKNKNLNISLISAFIVLLFAMAFPFKQFPILLELMPVLKQFRATGRFVWPFYFVFTTFAALTFQEIFFKLTSKKGNLYGVIFLILIFSISILEAIPYHKSVSKSITQYSNIFRLDLLSDDYRYAINKINPENYQAIISLPFYYQGSESFSRPRDDVAVRNSILFSYHTGLPIICANLTRTSVDESKKIVQIISPNFYTKHIVNDITSKKPFLIVKTNHKLTYYENLLYEKGRLLVKSADYELLKIDINDLFSDDRSKMISQFHENYPNLKKQDSFYVSDTGSFLYYNSYENKLSDTTFRGSGCFKSIKKGKNIFAEFPPNTFEIDKEYHVSMWMFNGEPDALNLWFRFIIEEYDKANNKWYLTTVFPEQSEVICDNWSLVESVFKINNPENYVYIISKGKKNSKASLHADDLLIKEKDVDVYNFENKKECIMNYNNHRIVMQNFACPDQGLR